MPTGTSEMLPVNNEDQLAANVQALVDAAKPYRNRERTRWLLTLLYMQGQRDFTSLDWINGTVQSTYINQPYAESSFRYEGVNDLYQTELGRLMQVDIKPVVSRRGQGLDGLRKSSTAQIILDDLMPGDRCDRLKLSLMSNWLKFGHVSTLVTVEGRDEGDVSVQMVPPWEVMSIPADPVYSEGSEGCIRNRWVSVGWLKKQGVKLGAKALLDQQEVVPGANVSTTESGMSSGALVGGPIREGYYSRGGNNSGGNNTFPQGEKIVELTEIWLRNQNNEVTRYIQKVGREITKDEGFEGMRVPMPLNHARYLDAGGFYGRAFVDKMIPLNTEAEFMMDKLFENVEDLDMLGFLCVPRTMGVSRDEITEARKGDKTLIYDPDPSNPQIQPFNLQPGNTGMLPAKIMEICLSVMRGSSLQSEMLQGGAPGRVDSAQGLSFLYEAANIPIASPMESFSLMMINTYRSLLWTAGNRWPDRKSVELTLSDDTLVGIEYNAGSGQVTLRKDMVPLPTEVNITIGAKKPVSEAQQRADLLQSLNIGAITPQEYRIKVREMGLSVPVGYDKEWQNYRRAKLENVVLYGDGVNPGTVVVDDNDMHEIHLEILQTFKSRPEYFEARGEEDKSAIWEAFDSHEEAHKAALGNYPEGVNYPEDEAALEQEQSMQILQQMKQGGGMPPQAQAQ